MMHVVGDTCAAVWCYTRWQQLLLVLRGLESQVLLVLLQQPCLLLLLLPVVVGRVVVGQTLSTPSCQGTVWGSTSCTARAWHYSCVVHHDGRAYVTKGGSSYTAGAAAGVSRHNHWCWRYWLKGCWCYWCR